MTTSLNQMIDQHDYMQMAPKIATILNQAGIAKPGQSLAQRLVTYQKRILHPISSID